MLVSVIVPTFNRAHVIENAIDSILAQDTGNCEAQIEIIVVDDGSTDNTRELIRQNYPDIVFLTQANRGVSAARNSGLRIAQGEWIALLDSDDEWLPHKLNTQMASLVISGLKVSHTEERWVRKGVRVNQMNKHKKSGGWIFQQCLPLCAMSPSSILLHRDVVEHVGEFDETLPACEDYDYWLRLTSCFEVDFIEQECIVKFGGHEDQLSRRFWGMDRFRVRALEKILQHDLDEEDACAAFEMLTAKLRILRQGAEKRGNSELVNKCRTKLLSLEAERDYNYDLLLFSENDLSSNHVG